MTRYLAANTVNYLADVDGNVGPLASATEAIAAIEGALVRGIAYSLGIAPAGVSRPKTILAIVDRRDAIEPAERLATFQLGLNQLVPANYKSEGLGYPPDLKIQVVRTADGQLWEKHGPGHYGKIVDGWLARGYDRDSRWVQMYRLVVETPMEQVDSPRR